MPLAPARALLPFFLAAAFFGLPVTGVAAEDPIYTVLEVPVAQSAAAAINNKSQVATTRAVGGGVMLDLWLPAADYGLEPGVHSYSMPLNLPGLPSPTTGFAVRSFADNGTVYFAHAVTFHDGVFAALSSFVPDRSDLIGFINMSANGIIYAKPWDPLTGSPGEDGKSRYLKTGPGHPREEYLGPPNNVFSGISWEHFHLRSGNSHGVQIVNAFIRDNSANSPSASGTWNGAFTQLPLPGGGVFIGINDKGQLLSNNGYFYLPSADYGRGSGFHAFTIPPGVELSGISGHGEIFRSWGTEFFSIEHDKTIDINQVLAPGTAATITQILWINDNGVILARGTLNGTPNKVLLVSPPAPQEFSITVPPGRYQPGDIITATIRVQTGNVEGLTVTMDHPLVVPDDPTLLEMVEEIEVEPFALNATSPPKVFEVQLRALAHGVAEVYASAISVDSDGVARELVDSAPVSISPLELSIRALPLIDGKSIVNLEIDDEGNITDEEGEAVAPKVEVEIENISTRPVKVFIQGVDPRARDRSNALGRIHVADEFPLELGVLEPGHTFTREFGLEIHEDGRFDFFVFVTGSVEGWPGEVSVSGRGAPLAIGAKYPVELELDFVRTAAITNQNNGAFLMEPGSSLQVLASVKNLTTNSTLQFYGMRAEKRLNAFGSVLTSDDGNLLDPPFAHDHEVDPQATLVLSGKILTEVEGAPTGTVKWVGLEDAVLVDDATEDKTELTEDDILVTSTVGGWLGDDLQLKIIQDHSRPAPPELTDSEAIALGVGHWSYGAMLGIGQWSYDSIDAIGGIGRVAGNIAANPSLLSDTMGEGARAVWESAEYAALGWQSMTPDEKDAFILAILSDVRQRAYFLGKPPFDPEEYDEALAYVRNATYSLFGGVEDAYESDDPAQIAEMLGRVSGNIAMEVATAALPTPKFTGFVKGAEAARLADSTALGKAMNVQEEFLRAVKSGPLAEETVRTQWGVGGQHLVDIQDVFRRFGVKGYARERAPESYRLIDELGEALMKPEAMKPKGLSDIDLLILDNDLPPILGKSPNNSVLNPQGITAIFMPEPDDVLEARLRAQGHSNEIIEVCKSRAALRRNEFEKYVPEFESWARPASEGGGMPISKNYKDNGVPDPTNDRDKTRQFRFDRHRREGKPTIYIPKMMNEAGTEYLYISGDLDWIHFSFLNGTPLDPHTAARLYDAMARAVGLQHPETISWINKGQTVFAGKIEQISEYLSGGKALLEVSGEGPRAVRMSENLTRFAKNGRDHLAFFDGGLKSRFRIAAADVETAFAYFQNKFPDRRIVAPFLWMLKGDQSLEDGTIGGNDWTFTTSDDARLLRQTAGGGGLEQFDGKTWIPYDLADQIVPLKLVPATSTAAPLAAGDHIIEIDDLPSAWPEQLVGHLDNWFETGQTVIINPGGDTPEIRKVVGLSSLILDRPLQYDHPEGTMVAVLTITDQSQPFITQHPTTVAITAGGAVNLTVAAVGAGPFTYQWYRDGVAVPGATGATFTLPSAQVFQSGDYSVEVANSFGANVSNTANLAVNAPLSFAGKMQNLSTRGLSLTGDNLLIPGFAIQGTGTKRLLIRAVGPTLADLGVNDALIDPRMVLKRLQNGAFVDVASNDNWETNANAADIISTSDRLFAFPLSTGSADSALLVDLQPGQYTVVTSGVNDTTGVAIVELYDADTGTPASRMTSISNRGFVDIGDKVMIPGIVVSPGGTKTVLIRVVGPTLGEAPFNVPGVLNDPILTLFKGPDVILTNDDWGTDSAMAAQVTSVGQSVFAFALTEGSADSAVVVTLGQGLYTVVASGANNTTGVALVEVYEVP